MELKQAAALITLFLFALSPVASAASVRSGWSPFPNPPGNFHQVGATVLTTSLINTSDEDLSHVRVTGDGTLEYYFIGRTGVESVRCYYSQGPVAWDEKITYVLPEKPVEVPALAMASVDYATGTAKGEGSGEVLAQQWNEDARVGTSKETVGSGYVCKIGEESTWISVNDTFVSMIASPELNGGYLAGVEEVTVENQGEAPLLIEPEDFDVSFNVSGVEWRLMTYMPIVHEQTDNESNVWDEYVEYNGAIGLYLPPGGDHTFYIEYVVPEERVGQSVKYDIGFQGAVIDPYFYSTQSNFNGGTYNLTRLNATGFVQLSLPATTGFYLSRVFDALVPVNWSNVTWYSTDLSGGVTLGFRSCDDSACAGDAWGAALSGANVSHALSAGLNRYGQYNVTFDSSNSSVSSSLWNVTIDYDLPGWCYQETATTGTACGGLSNGSYAAGGAGCLPTGAWYDGDWSTYDSVDSSCSFHSNYSIPNGTNAVILRSKFDVSYGADMSIVCWNYSDSTFSEVNYSFNLGLLEEHYQVPSDCVSNLTLQLRHSGQDYNFYEEAVYWNFTETTTTTTSSTTTTTTSTTTTTTTTTLAPCGLSVEEVTSNCTGGVCQSGDTVYLNGTLNGSALCGNATKYQIDGYGLNCSIQFTGGDLNGITGNVSILNPYTWATSVWTVPSIPANCLAVNVSAGFASLWQGDPGVGVKVSQSPSNNASGWFVLGTTTSTTSTSSTTTTTGNVTTSTTTTSTTTTLPSTTTTGGPTTTTSTTLPSNVTAGNTTCPSFCNLGSPCTIYYDLFDTQGVAAERKAASVYARDETSAVVKVFPTMLILEENTWFDSIRSRWMTNATFTNSLGQYVFTFVPEEPWAQPGETLTVTATSENAQTSCGIYVDIPQAPDVGMTLEVLRRYAGLYVAFGLGFLILLAAAAWVLSRLRPW